MKSQYIIKYFSKSHGKTRYFLNQVKKNDEGKSKLQFSYEEKDAFKFINQQQAKMAANGLTLAGYKGLQIIEVEPVMKLVVDNGPVHQEVGPSMDPKQMMAFHQSVVAHYNEEHPDHPVQLYSDVPDSFKQKMQSGNMSAVSSEPTAHFDNDEE